MPQKEKVGRAPTLKELPADGLKEQLARALASLDAQIHQLKVDTQNRRWADIMQEWKDLIKLLAPASRAIDEVARRLARR